MKLYLTSYRIPDIAVLEDLVGKQTSQIKVGVIPNAKDYYAPRARAVKIRLVTTYLEGLGMKPGVVDLYDYHTAEQLAPVLKQYDLLWAMGGNTFCLREAMYGSGFDEAVHEALEAGVVYGGESAGTCVAGNDLRGIEYADPPEYAEKPLWKGLKLANHYFIPHADNEDFAWAIQPIIESRGKGADTIILNDNQAWVVNGAESWKITGVKTGSEETAA